MHFASINFCKSVDFNCQFNCGKRQEFTKASAFKVLLLYVDFRTFPQFIIGIFITPYFKTNILNTTDV